MNNLESIKKRIKKLLALSKSPNENEAAKAIEMANMLAGKYGVNIEHCNSYVSKPVKSSKRYVSWRAVLANSVENLYATYHVKNEAGEYVFYGEELDVFMATEMFSYLVKTVDRMVRNNVRKNAKYNYRQSYRQGVAMRLYERIELLGKNCSWRNNAELENQKREIKEYIETSGSLINCKTKKIKQNINAYTRGVIDGDGVSLCRQMNNNAVLQIAEL